MKIVVTNADIIPSSGALSQAGARGIENLIKAHLRDRDMSRSAPKNGLPHSGYWADAADSTTVRGNTVEIDKEGAALHYHGGTVTPKNGKKSLAIPIDPSVAGIWPSEAGMDLDVIWFKGNRTGFLKDPSSGDLLWLLIPKATIKADPTVLPDDQHLYLAAEDAIVDAMEAYK